MPKTKITLFSLYTLIQDLQESTNSSIQDLQKSNQEIKAQLDSMESVQHNMAGLVSLIPSIQGRLDEQSAILNSLHARVEALHGLVET